MNNSVSVPAGRQRFDFFLLQLQDLLEKAAATDNPALFLYQQNVRTPLFMLEALSRLYKEMHNKKIFDKAADRLKAFEDQLGKVDYYDGFSKEFATDEKIPEAIKAFLKKQFESSLAELNDQLKTKAWIGKDNKRIKKIMAKLGKAGWFSPEADAAAVKDVYKKNIKSIVKSIRNNEINFDHVETDVHELRRELRWLSIYPQALRGLIQLKQSAGTPGYLNKYLEPAILNSPFNKMPEPGDQKNIIYLDADNFYALSWLIAELGKLKDNGLKIVVLKEALQSLNKLSDAEAEKQATMLCGEGQLSTQDILLKAKKISMQFFNEKIPEHLVCD